MLYNQLFSNVSVSLIAISKALYILSALEKGGRWSLKKQVDDDGSLSSTGQSKKIAIYNNITQNWQTSTKMN